VLRIAGSLPSKPGEAGAALAEVDQARQGQDLHPPGHPTFLRAGRDGHHLVGDGHPRWIYLSAPERTPDPEDHYSEGGLAGNPLTSRSSPASTAAWLMSRSLVAVSSVTGPCAARARIRVRASCGPGSASSAV
jgi:hypothetical protein